jgi:tetratricopeptide (TPR) repeat protein
VSVSAITAHDERERKTLAHAHMSAHERELYTPSSDDDNELKPSLDSLKEQIDDETNLYELGRILWRMSQLDASERCFKRLLKQEHSNPVIIPGCYLHLGNIASNREQYDEAIAYHRYGLELKQKTLPPNHPHLAYSHNSLGEALRKHGDFDEALVQYKSALALWQQEYGANDHENIAMCLHNIGTVYAQRDELQEAMSYFTHALKVMERCLPTIHPKIACTLRNIGSVLGLVGRSEQAREAFSKQ